MILPPILIDTEFIIHIKTYQVIFLGSNFKGGVSLFTTLHQFVRYAVSSRSIIFKLIFSTSFSFLPLTIGHTNIGYLNISSVWELRSFSYIEDSTSSGMKIQYEN